ELEHPVPALADAREVPALDREGVPSLPRGLRARVRRPRLPARPLPRPAPGNDDSPPREARARRGLGGADEREALRRGRPAPALARGVRPMLRSLLRGEAGGSSVTVATEGRVGVLRRNKPRGNAIDEPFLKDLLGAAHAVAADGAVHAVLLSSAHSKLFCPGLD